MKSSYEMSKELQYKFENYLAYMAEPSKNRPKQFIKKMKSHLNFANPDNFSREQLDLRNPLIVVLGDSVSGGHFDTINLDSLEIVQSLSESYVEQFKILLHQQFPLTCPSIINSSLAGDNVVSMRKRLQRDVIVHQPDLVIINASLNWSKRCSSSFDYQEQLESILQSIFQNTSAEIVLMTPNLAISQDSQDNLKKRIYTIRQLADQYQLCLADVSLMWEEVTRSRKELIETLSNQQNHPTPLGHYYMAQLLIKSMIGKEQL